MQNNPPPNDQRIPSSPPPKPQRSMSRNLPHSATFPTVSRMQDLPHHTPQQRFSLTPQNAGMDLSSLQQPQNAPSSAALKQRPPQSTMPAQMKPYVRQDLTQPVNKTAYDSSITAEVGRGEQVTEQNASAPTTLVSAPISPTPRIPPSATSIMAATLSTTQQMFKSYGPTTVNTSMSPPTTPTNDRQCPNPTHRTSSSHLSEIPTAYYEQQMQKFRSGSVGETAKINGEMNAVFLQRLRDIDENGQGDTDLKLVTYQEWVDMLIKINESLINNMEQLELDVAERLEFLQRRVNLNCRHSQGNELMKCRKDIDTLMKIIQNASNYNEWDIHGMTFETITPAQIFALPDNQQQECLNAVESELQMRNTADPEIVQRNKLLAHVKALAIEVADKHDEVRELKRQVVCLEDEIQKAQKKIQFKDDVIKELRNDLKRNAKLISGELCLPMSPINLDTQRSETSTLVSEGHQLMPFQEYDDGSFQYESLSHNEQLEEEALKTLEHEFNEYIKMSDKINKEQMVKHRNRLSEILQKSEMEKAAAYRKLEFIHRQLIDLETSGVSGSESADCDSGISSKKGSDQYVKILESVRKRLRNLNETATELRKQVQKLELENNELSTSLQSAKSFSERNSETLKSVADLLCNMTGDFSYTDMYNNLNSQCGTNPFCEAIMNIKQTYMKREEQLIHTVGLKNQKIEELTQTLLDQEKLHAQQQRRLTISEGEDIDNITPPASLSAQPQAPQRQQRQSSQQ